MSTAAASQRGHASPRLVDPADDGFGGRLEATIAESQSALKRRQAADGHWQFDLEADATIPSEFVLLEHYLGEIDDATEGRIANYLRHTQGEHGGWPLFYRGDFNISASVKAYYALKLSGDDPAAPHMQKARAAILAHGGAATANVFARTTLALFGQVPWRAVPTMPVEIMLLPRWFPFHLDKVSYWSRTVIVPLLVLMALRPRARNPRGIGIAELFVVPPDEQPEYQTNPTGSRWGEMFLVIDKLQPPAGHRAGDGLVDRAAERRGWPGRDLSGDGRHRHGLRCARLPGQ